MADKTQPKRP